MGTINSGLNAAADIMDKRKPTKAVGMFEELPPDDRDIDWSLKCTTMMYTSLVLVLMLLGAIGICAVEGLGFVDGLFWAFQTCTTVGYGNVRLTSPSSQWFGGFYAMFSVTTVGALITAIGEAKKEAK